MNPSVNEYEQLIDCMMDGFVKVDLNGKILKSNLAYQKMVGYSTEELIQHSYIDLTPKKWHDFQKKLFKEQLFTQGYTNIYEKEYIKKDGTVFPVEFRATLIKDENNAPVGMWAIGRDISLRKRLEREREELLSKITGKNEELEQIINILVHDIRTPMANIQGFNKEVEHSLNKVLDIIHKQINSSETNKELNNIIKKDIFNYQEKIKTSLLKIDSFVNGLLKVMRLGWEKLSINNINMNNFIYEILETFNYKIKVNKINVEIGNLPECAGDVMQINQLFSNLIDNAIKFMDKKRKGKIKITGKKNNNNVEYCIEDNGIGINSENHDKIFELFTRLNQNETSGEGLGLNFVAMIVRRHNGSIKINSEKGKGSKFYISLPVLTNFNDLYDNFM
jgi:PAS domain S-box-containing protein